MKTTTLKNLIDGMRQAIVLSSDSEYVVPSRGDFRQDIEKLNNDIGRVARDMRKMTWRYVKVHDRKG